MPQPRRHRMRRPTRLDSARSWLQSGADATVRTYARRYGVDRYTAYDELQLLGVPLAAKDERWSVPTPGALTAVGPRPTLRAPGRTRLREPPAGGPDGECRQHVVGDVAIGAHPTVEGVRRHGEVRGAGELD